MPRYRIIKRTNGHGDYHYELQEQKHIFGKWREVPIYDSMSRQIIARDDAGLQKLKDRKAYLIELHEEHKIRRSVNKVEVID